MELKTISDVEIQHRIDTFMEEYFGYAKKVLNYNLYFIEENSLDEPLIDYTKLKRFIDSAIDKIHEIDESVVDILVAKLLKDSTSLYDFMIDLEKKIKAPKIVFKQEFMPTIDYYKKLKSEVDNLTSLKSALENIIASTDAELKAFPQKRSKEQEIEYKKIKSSNVDATHKLSELKDELGALSVALMELEKKCAPLFIPNFNENSKEILAGLKKVTNIKIYYLNALLWNRAKDSIDLNTLFQKAGINGGISLKTFIKYYIRGVDMTKTKNQQWYSYLTECLEELR